MRSDLSAATLADVVAHTLAVITVQAGVGRRLAARHPEEASKALESIEMIGPISWTASGSSWASPWTSSRPPG